MAESERSWRIIRLPEEVVELEQVEAAEVVMPYARKR
jgi:hypothetical protein